MSKTSPTTTHTHSKTTLTKRAAQHVFRALSLGILLGLAGCAELQNPATTNPAPEETGGGKLETFTSDANAFDTHSFWLDTGREVIVFDAQFTPSWAKRLIDEIRSKTSSPIRWVVVTHPNPDKFNGASAFQAIGAKVVASKRTSLAIPDVHKYKKGYFVNVAKSFTDETYPSEAKIDVTFEGDFDLPLDSTTTKVTLHELKHRGVSSTQTVAFIPRLNAVVVGDLVHHNAHAWLEGGIVDGKPVPDLASWQLALEELGVKYGTATVFGGRGEAAKVEVAVAAERAYLTTLNTVVRRYVTQLGPQALQELSGPAAGGHYKAISTEAAKAYPAYSLPYMIEYGVYGLALQVAAKPE